MSFYVEYLYNVLNEHDEQVKEYVIIRLLTYAHVKIIEEIRREGLKTYNHEYTIDNFFDDLAKRNIYFEIIISDVVYEFGSIPELTDDKKKEKTVYHHRVEIQ